MFLLEPITRAGRAGRGKFGEGRGMVGQGQLWVWQGQGWFWQEQSWKKLCIIMLENLESFFWGGGGNMCKG